MYIRFKELRRNRGEKVSGRSGRRNNNNKTQHSFSIQLFNLRLFSSSLQGTARSSSDGSDLTNQIEITFKRLVFIFFGNWLDSGAERFISNWEDKNDSIYRDRLKDRQTYTHTHTRIRTYIHAFN